MTLERVEVCRPAPAERHQPVVELAQRFRDQSIETALCIHSGLHKSGITQHAEVLRNGWLRHLQLPLDFSNRLFRGDQQPQDGAAVGLGNDVEDGRHAVYIRLKEYTCQGIYEGVAAAVLVDRGPGA